MSKEQGLLNKDNAERILRGVSDKSFFKGSFSKTSSGLSHDGDANAPAIVEMHNDLAVATGRMKASYEQTAAQELANSVLPTKYSSQQWADGLVPALLDKEAEKQKYNEIASQAIANAKQNG